MSDLRIILAVFTVLGAFYGIALLIDPPCYPHCNAYAPAGFMGPPR